MAKHPDISGGFSTGLKYWLLFMVSLFVLGYSPFLSICLGAIGGIAGGFIIAWWKPKDDLKGDASGEKETKAEVDVKDKLAPSPTRKVHFRKEGLDWGEQRRSRGSRRFGWLFQVGKIRPGKK